MNNRIIMTLSFFCLMLMSCGDDDDKLVGGRTRVVYEAPECTRGWAYCGKSAVVTDDQGNTYEIKTTLNTGDTVRIGKALLGFITNDDVWDRISKYPQSSSWREMYDAGELDSSFVSYVLEPLHSDFYDETIERQLDAYYHITRANLVVLQYRTTPVKDMTITSDIDICGRKAGESLNDLFTVMGYHDSKYPFIVTVDKQVVTSKADILDIPVSCFLGYHPMAPVRITMRMNSDAMVEAETKACFFVTLTLENDRVIRMKTHEVVVKP